MVASKESAPVFAGHPSYPDHCRWCRRAGRITWTSRDWLHFPSTVVPAAAGTVVAYYRCRRCGAQWTCGWADGGIDRDPSGKTPPELGTAVRRGVRSRPAAPTS